jgi:hypothetical protein
MLRYYCIQTAIKKKINHDYNSQELWNMMERPNLRILGVEERAIKKQILHI